MAEHIVPIPEPPGLPIIGFTDFDRQLPLRTLINLADKYGEIYKITTAGKARVVVSSNALVNEICDETRFGKKVAGALEEVRNGVHDGLFTAYGEQEPNWGIAHRILMPAFGPLAIKGMFDEMHDIASQLVMKWARYGPDHVIHASDDFTRLTLDTLALCAMDYRFNSYYSPELHPFIEAMGSFLTESGLRSQRLAITSIFYRQAEYKYKDDIELMRKTADDVLQTRKAHPNERKDLLNAMLNGRDPKTGQGLSDSSITDNLITFLIAGHETTSGLLSFVFYNLIKHPEAYRKAQQEVDDVIGSGPITVEHMSKLPFINAVLRETLRQNATIPAFALAAKEDTVIGGKYQLKAGEPVVAFLTKMHADPVVYGDDANEWKPERMLDENFERLSKEFPNSWKPFGNGMRGCIGRAFAWQESLLVVAILLQNFNFVAADPNYQLAIKQTLTIKPKDFHMRAILRKGTTPTSLEHALQSTTGVSLKDPTTVPKNQEKAVVNTQASGKPLHIFYGSNTGTCEALAQRLASDATGHGFQAKIIDSLDAAKQKMPSDEPVVIITASYEGQPPDNAAHFVGWLESLKEKEMEKVSYAVFGCGHHDWAQTFHRIPKLVDDLLEKRGGSRISPMGLTDVASGDMFTEFETWEDKVFWPAMIDKYGAGDGDSAEPFQSGITVEISTPRTSTLRQDVQEAHVVATKTLSAPGAPEKKHIEIKLPSDATYRAGDYLAILPLNPKENVARALRHFSLPWDSHMNISASGPTTLPTNVSIPAADVFGAYVELAQPATKRNIASLIEATKDETTKATLKTLSEEAYSSEISAKRVSVLDLLEKYPSIDLRVGSFLAMLPPMRVRQYSISSSPLWNPHHVTLTYAVLDQPSLSGTGRYVGVASNYLSTLTAGDTLHVSVRPSIAFHLPTDGEKVPIIMIAAGSGLAPFRGFIQERAAQIGAGRELAPALLFFGCRSPTQDDLYKEELSKWEAMGAIRVLRSFSRDPEQSNGCKYVQDRLWDMREEVCDIWDSGAKVFVCGSKEVGEGVKETVLRICMETVRDRQIKETGSSSMTMEKAVDWFQRMRNERFATDVFA